MQQNAIKCNKCKGVYVATQLTESTCMLLSSCSTPFTALHCKSPHKKPKILGHLAWHFGSIRVQITFDCGILQDNFIFFFSFYLPENANIATGKC